MSYPGFASLIFDDMLSLKTFQLSAAKNRRSIAQLDSVAYEVYLDLKAKKRILENELVGKSRDDGRIKNISQDIYQLEKRFSSFIELPADNKENESWEDVKQSLGPDEAAVEYLLIAPKKGEQYYAALILRPQMKWPGFVRLADKKNVDRQIMHRTKTEISSVYDDPQSLLQLIFHEVWDYISDARRIYIVPAGGLHLINLQALLWNADRNAYRTPELIRISSSKDILSRVDESITCGLRPVYLAVLNLTSIRL